MKQSIVILFFLAIAHSLFGQNEASNRYERPSVSPFPPFLSNYIITESRSPLYLPEMDGYTLLKCDFHLHTVFSDGVVWPVTRVEEAFREGLDAIAITEHIEFRSINRDDVNTDNYMREYEIAKKKADELGILLVPGYEVTREVPPGHFNVLFVENPELLKEYIDFNNPRDASTIEGALQKSKELGGFIFWNHPPYQMPNGAEWTKIHQSIFEKGLMMGIEIINSNMYVPIAQKWAEEKGLTIMANTDMHANFRIKEGYFRAMTIVLARNRSVSAIKEALFNKQTIAYANNYLFGRKTFLEPIFKKSIKTRVLHSSNKELTLEIRNLSSIPFAISFDDNSAYKPARINNDGITVYGNKTVAVKMIIQNESSGNALQVTVNNLVVKTGESLRTTIPF